MFNPYWKIVIILNHIDLMSWFSIHIERLSLYCITLIWCHDVQFILKDCHYIESHWFDGMMFNPYWKIAIILNCIDLMSWCSIHIERLSLYWNSLIWCHDVQSILKDCHYIESHWFDVMMFNPYKRLSLYWITLIWCHDVQIHIERLSLYWITSIWCHDVSTLIWCHDIININLLLFLCKNNNYFILILSS